MGKQFMYACAGIALLMVGIGSLSHAVAAQGFGQVWMGDVRDHTAAVATGRSIRYVDTETGTYGSLPPVPGSSAIAALDLVAPGAAGVPPAIVVLDDGSVYEIPARGSAWVPVPGSLLSGPTATARSSWGDVKARYR